MAPSKPFRYGSSSLIDHFPTLSHVVGNLFKTHSGSKISDDGQATLVGTDKGYIDGFDLRYSGELLRTFNLQQLLPAQKSGTDKSLYNAGLQTIGWDPSDPNFLGFQTLDNNVWLMNIDKREVL
eukprot:TRINITY_DN4499_c0_g1_i1.p1 TRINITY_DN4499_c0_g1~~TRINITY_DN4499_c0_g1_i1.p1  ORF type:complete len:124 (+),score=19.19 TRINITY_DN4499_c0_g1_i1:878-1249(+)